MATKNLTLSELAGMSSITPTAGETGADFLFVLPIRENITEGWKNSIIVKVEPTYADDSDETSVGTLQHLDVFHELTDANSNVDIYRFRLYPEFGGIKKWAKRMQKYGLTGAPTDVVGLREQVKVAFGKKSDYGYIADRKLVALPCTQISHTASTEEADTVIEDDTPTDESISADPPRKKGGGPLKVRHPHKITVTPPKSLLDDDEFDDFLLEDDDEAIE